MSGNAKDARHSAVSDSRPARGLAGPILLSNGQLIDRLNSLTNSQIDIKVYVLEVDKTAQSHSRAADQLRSRCEGRRLQTLRAPRFPFFEVPQGPGHALNVGPFYRTIGIALDAQPHDARRPRLACSRAPIWQRVPEQRRHF